MGERESPKQINTNTFIVIAIFYNITRSMAGWYGTPFFIDDDVLVCSSGGDDAGCFASTACYKKPEQPRKIAPCVKRCRRRRCCCLLPKEEEFLWLLFCLMPPPSLSSSSARNEADSSLSISQRNAKKSKNNIIMCTSLRDVSPRRGCR